MRERVRKHNEDHLREALHAVQADGHRFHPTQGHHGQQQIGYLLGTTPYANCDPAQQAELIAWSGISSQDRSAARGYLRHKRHGVSHRSAGQRIRINERKTWRIVMPLWANPRYWILTPLNPQTGERCG